MMLVETEIMNLYKFQEQPIKVVITVETRRWLKKEDKNREQKDEEVYRSLKITYDL